jgi:hypothetical protein
MKKQWRRHWSGHYGHVEKGGVRLWEGEVRLGTEGVPNNTFAPGRPKPSHRYCGTAYI